MLVDQHRVQQVLINLISNALKFSPYDSVVLVEFKRGESYLVPGKFDIFIHVSDSGIGMSKKDLSNLFKPFFRSKDSDSRQRNPRGNGLGLSICANIAKSMGGDLRVLSQLGQGSKFTLAFPAIET